MERQDGWMILGEYTEGMADNQKSAFNFELSDIVDMYGRGDIDEAKLREICGKLRDGYLSPPLVDQEDD